MNTFNMPVDDQVFKDGSPITIACLPGYEVVIGKESSFNATCEANGHWSGISNCSGQDKNLCSTDDFTIG